MYPFKKIFLMMTAFSFHSFVYAGPAVYVLEFVVVDEAAAAATCYKSCGKGNVQGVTRVGNMARTDGEIHYKCSCKNPPSN